MRHLCECGFEGHAVKLTPRVGKPSWGCPDCRSPWDRPESIVTMTQGAEA